MSSEIERDSKTYEMDAVAGIAVAVTVVGWASAFPAIRAGLESFGPLELGAVRFAIAAVPAIIYLAIVRPTFPKISELWRFAFGGVVFVALYTGMLNIGEQTVSAGAASFIINVSPILTAVMAMLMLGERFSLVAWAGTFLSFAGIGIIALGESNGLQFNTGTVLIVGAALCTASNTIIQKPLFSHHKPLSVAAWNMVLGAICLLPFLPNGITEMHTADTSGLIAVVYLGIVPSLIAYAAWATALSRLPAARATNYLYCVSPTATLIGFFWLGEVPTSLGIVGGAMALAGVAIVNLKH